MVNPDSVKPIGDRILVKVDEPQKQSPGGLLLPDTAQERPRRGKVLKVGPGKVREGVGNEDGPHCVPIQVKEGDIVVFGSYAGTHIDPDDDLLMMMTEADILAVVG